MTLTVPLDARIQERKRELLAAIDKLRSELKNHRENGGLCRAEREHVEACIRSCQKELKEIVT
jgi:hypothetical protein